MPKILDEEFHVFLLLMHGGDPEPNQNAVSDRYDNWRMAVQDTIEKHTTDPKHSSEHAFIQHFDWLAENGLAWTNEQEENGSG